MYIYKYFKTSFTVIMKNLVRCQKGFSALFWIPSPVVPIDQNRIWISSGKICQNIDKLKSEMQKIFVFIKYYAVDFCE